MCSCVVLAALGLLETLSYMASIFPLLSRHQEFCLLISLNSHDNHVREGYLLSPLIDGQTGFSKVNMHANVYMVSK